MDTVNEGRPVCLPGVKLHILTPRASFNLHTRRADAGSLNRPETRGPPQCSSMRVRVQCGPAASAAPQPLQCAVYTAHTPWPA